MSYLVIGSNFEFMEHGKVDLGHDEGHQENRPYDIRVLGAVHVDLCR